MKDFKQRIKLTSKFGFSLAETLLVLLIMSFLIVAIAPISYKQITKKVKRDHHGRFECYYDSSGNLHQYKADEITGGEDKIISGDDAVCTFEPPSSAAFYIVQAIGGGAGGTYVDKSGRDIVSESKNVSFFNIDSYSSWVRDISDSLKTHFAEFSFTKAQNLTADDKSWVTPAEVEKEVSDRIQEVSSQLYDLLNCKGIVRFDFRYDVNKKELFFLEVNTIPGQSAESIVPKEARAMGISAAELYEMAIQAAL